MTKRNALGVRRRLVDARIVLEDNRAPENVLAEVTQAITSLDAFLQKEVCPACKHLLRNWYDHADNCSVK